MIIQDLFRRTDADRKFLAKYVRLIQTKIGYTPDGYGFVAAKTQSTHHVDRHGFLVRTPVSQRNTYATIITFIDHKLNVRVSCSCHDFMYRQEYALFKRKAAEITYSNGEPALTTNPTNKPYMCKHLCALYMKHAKQIPTVK